MDLLSLDVMTPAEEGRPMTIRHPATGAVVLGADGKPVTITLRGMRSTVARETLRRFNDESAAMESGGQKVTLDQVKARNVQYLTALSVGWSDNLVYDGQTFPFTPGNAETLWKDDRLINIREQALRFVSEDGSFIAPSA